MSAESVLSIKNLSVNYGVIRALKNISLDINKGEIISLIGSNGAGKTTTLRAISSILKPNSGTITFYNENIVGIKPHLLVSKGISHSPEGRGIFANLTVLENLEMGAYTQTNKKFMEEDLEKVFKLFPRVKERLKQVAGTLSGGEQQMVAMSRALMSRPKLLLLDEPSLGLAPQIVDTIFQIIQQVNKEGMTVLLVEQNAFQALKIAHRGYVIETGEVVLEGLGKDLLTNPKVKEAYLGG